MFGVQRPGFLFRTKLLIFLEIFLYFRGKEQFGRERKKALKKH